MNIYIAIDSNESDLFRTLFVNYLAKDILVKL